MRLPLAIRPFQRLLSMLRQDRRDIVHLYLFALLRGLIMLSLPLGIQAIINLIGGGQVATSWGVLIGFVTMGVLFAGILQVMELSLSEHLKQRVFARAALEFAHRLPRIRSSAVHGRYLPELANRFFDTLTVQKGLNKVLIDVPVSAMQILLSLVLLAFYHPFFIGFGLFLLLLLFLLFRITGQNGLRTSLQESKHKFDMAHWLEELGRGNATFKLAGITSIAENTADTIAERYIKARRAHFRVLLGHYWGMVGFKAVITLSLLVLGGILVFTERMNIGQFVAAEIIIILLLNAVERVILGLEAIYDVLTAMEKLGEVTDLPLEKEHGQPIARTLAEGGPMAVELKRLVFRSHWSGEPILNGIDLRIAPGEKVCISGPDGSGKSTLLQLIAGMVEPNEGNVLLDGQGLRSLSPAEARSAMGDSFNQEELFSATVLENIIMGRPWVTEAHARDAAERTGLMPMLAGLPDGLLTRLDPLGSRLPRSLVKRIIVARCLAGQPRLVLFEDDALPIAGEEQRVLLELLTGPAAPFTLIAVSNDPAFRRHCTRTLRLEKGRLAADSGDGRPNT